MVANRNPIIAPSRWVILLFLLGWQLWYWPATGWHNLAYLASNHTLAESTNYFALSQNAFGRALANNPQNESAKWGAGWLFWSMGEETAALQQWGHNLLAPQYLPIYAERANAARDWATSAQFYTVLVAIEPNDPAYWLEYGHTL